MATPYARKFLGLDSEGIGQTVQQYLTQALDAGRILLSLPRSLEQVISKLETGQIEVRLAGTQAREAIRFRGRRRRSNNALGGSSSGSSGGFPLAFVFATAMVGGIFLMTTAHLMLPGWLCLGFAGLTVLGMLLRR